MPNFLAASTKSTPAVFQYVNSTPTQLGTTFGSSYGGTGATTDCNKNHAIQFQGELFCMTRDGVYKKDDPTVTSGGWTIQIAFTTPETTRPTGTGLHPIVVNGTSHLVGLFGESSQLNRWRWVKFDGTTWTQSSSYTEVAGISARLVIDTIVYRGLLHLVTGDLGASAMLTYNPTTNVFAFLGNPFEASQTPVGLGIYNDRLFALGGVATTDVGLLEFTGGSWSSVGVVEAGIGPVGFIIGKWACFSDGTYLYLIYGRVPATVNSRGWRAARWSPTASPNFLDISTEVLPSTLLSVTDGGTHSTTTNIYNERLIPVYDSDTSTSSPVIYLYYALNGTSGTAHTMYQWNLDPADVATSLPGDPTNLMTSVDSGGDTYHSLPAHLPQGGCRIFTPGELDVKITSRLGVLGGEEITFTAYGGGTNRNFKLFYSTGGNPTLSEATLKAPVTGGSATLNTGANQVEGVAADGTTVYTVVWDIETDAVSAGTLIDRFPQISI